MSSGTTTIHSVSEFAYSDIRSAGHIEFQPGQAHVFTDDASSEAKVAGYVAAPGTKLGDAFSVDWTGTGVAPGAQIALSGGSLGSGSILVFETVHGGNDLWLTNSSAQVLKDNAPDTSPGSGSPWHGTPAAWQGVLDELGFTVIGMGFSLGSSVLSDGTLTSVTAGCHTMLFDVPAPPVGDPTCVSTPGSTTIHSVSEFAYSDIRSAGHIEFQPGQAHVFTDDASSEAKVAGYVAAPGTKLGDAFSVDWTGTGVAPGAQIALSGGSLGSGSILVFETVHGGNDLWLTNSSAQVLKDNAPDTSPGSGSPWHGTPAAWQGVLDELGFTVIGMGFSLGSSVLSDGTLTSVTAGCHTMLFDIPPISTTTTTTTATSTTTTIPSSSTTTIPETSTTAAPTTSPTTTVPANGGIRATIDDTTAVVGQVLTVNGFGFQPGEPVTATLFSTPRSLGTATASVATVTYVFTTENDDGFGSHSVSLTGPLSGTVAVSFVLESRAGLPQTGSAVSATAATAAVLLIAGTGLVLLSVRPRRRIS